VSTGCAENARGTRPLRRGYAVQVPLLLKVLLLAARSKRGREMLFAGTLAAIELARSERAREAYGKVRTRFADTRPRALASNLARKVAQHTRP
jgi:hypothetical protein